MWKNIAFHFFHGPHSGYTALLVVAILLFVRASFDDVFIDESESVPSEIANEKHGLKATRITRPIMMAIPLFIAAFAVWKLWQP